MRTDIYNNGVQCITCDWCGDWGHLDQPNTWEWLKSPEGDLCGSCVARARQLVASEAVTA